RVSSQAPPCPALAVQSQPKRNPRHPCPKLLSFAQRIRFLEGSQERLLGHVLGVGSVSENAVSNLKHATLVLGDANAECSFRFLHFCSRHQCAHPVARHANQSFSSAKTPRESFPFSNVSRNSGYA